MLQTSKVFNELVDTRYAKITNARLHIQHGIALTVRDSTNTHPWDESLTLCFSPCPSAKVGTLVHVWSIILPVLFSGYTSEVAVGTFEWPLRSWANFLPSVTASHNDAFSRLDASSHVLRVVPSPRRPFLLPTLHACIRHRSSLILPFDPFAQIAANVSPSPGSRTSTLTRST